LLLKILFTCFFKILIFWFVFYLYLVEFITYKNQPIDSLIFGYAWKNTILLFIYFNNLLFNMVRIIAVTVQNICLMTFKIIDVWSYFRGRFKSFLSHYLIFLILLTYYVWKCLIGLLVTVLLIFWILLFWYFVLSIYYIHLQIRSLLTIKLCIVIWIIAF
jgi:hypothetical protein